MPDVKDRRPAIPGSYRAAAILAKHCRIDPYVHQADGLACMLERLERFDSFGLLHDMGCGKTLTTLGAFLELYEQGSAESMLVVCPSSVVGAWQTECENIVRRGGVEIDVLALTHVQVKKRQAQLEEWLRVRRTAKLGGERVRPGIVAMNYESTWRMEDELKAAAFDIDVCDESQRIKAAGSNQSLAMHRIGKAPSQVGRDAWRAAGAASAASAPRMPRSLAPKRIIMTGTPVPEGALDWYGQFRFLDVSVFGKNHGDFKAKYAREIDCGNFKKIVVNQFTLPELETKVMERVHRVSKEQAVDLPEQTHVQLGFELAPKQRKMYDDLVRDSIAMVSGYGAGLPDVFSQALTRDAEWMNEDEIVGDNVLTRMLRLQQICGGYMQIAGRDSVVPCVLDSKGRPINPKLKVLADLAETLLDANAKLVIFHRFTHEGLAIQELAQRLSGKNTPVSVINGSIKTSDRKEMVRQFQEGDAMIFVAQIQAAAEGITLNAAADGAFYSSPFAAAVFQQALARYHRIGQTRAVTHHHLTAIDTIDQSLFASQMQKRDAAIEHVDNGFARYLRGEHRAA